mmetsp:Transcript_20366/g.60735  ORF Transcript_20366/g.60735 Transcript_20366/m.60735 type:complete len:242 (+) Transcript_20366:200-925(+)
MTDMSVTRDVSQPPMSALNAAQPRNMARIVVADDVSQQPMGALKEMQSANVASNFCTDDLGRAASTRVSTRVDARRGSATPPRRVPGGDARIESHAVAERAREDGDRRRIPAADVTGELAALEENVRHVRHRARVPRADAGAAEVVAVREHEGHVRDRRGVPRADVVVEVTSFLKQPRHVRHAPDLPRADRSVPALGRGLVLEVLRHRRAEALVREAQVVLDGVLHLGRQVVVGQGALARV